MEVVRRVRDPLRDEPTVLLVEVDRDHLPVRLVVVDAVEAGAPRVVGEEEPVLADRPAALTDDPALVDVPLVLLAQLGVLERGRGRGRARDVAAQEQREREEAVDEPRQQTSAGEPADPGVELALLALGQLTLTGQRLRAAPEGRAADEAQVEERPERCVAPLDERRRASAPPRRPLPRRLRRARTATGCSPAVRARRPSGRTSRPSCSGRSARRPAGSRRQTLSIGFRARAVERTLRGGRTPKAIWTSSGVSAEHGEGVNARLR